MAIIVERSTSAGLAAVRKLYESAFPVEERRPWPDFQSRISDAGNIMELHVARTADSGEFAGFITLWQLPSAVYVEHFAIADSMRGRGIGSLILESVKAYASPRPIVLEVELPGASPEAVRRIGFYERAGFSPHPDYPYSQPAYSTGLPAVPMMLMTHGNIKSPHCIAGELYKIVYGVSVN